MVAHPRVVKETFGASRLCANTSVGLRACSSAPFVLHCMPVIEAKPFALLLIPAPSCRAVKTARSFAGSVFLHREERHSMSRCEPRPLRHARHELLWGHRGLQRGEPQSCREVVTHDQEHISHMSPKPCSSQKQATVQRKLTQKQLTRTQSLQQNPA